MRSLGLMDRARVGVREVMGSISVEDSDFFLIPRSCHVGHFTFYILYRGLKFTILIHVPLISLIYSIFLLFLRLLI